MGFAAVRYFPDVNVPIEPLRGWRGFQLINLGTLVMSIPLFVLLANYIQRKFLATPYWCHRVGLALLVAATTSGVALARDYVLDGLGPNQAKHQETEEELESPFDSFRLSADEPGEAMG